MAGCMTTAYGVLGDSIGETALSVSAAVLLRRVGTLIARGFSPLTCAMDKGYDAAPFYDAFDARKCVAIIPLKRPMDKGRGRRPTTRLAASTVSGRSPEQTSSGTQPSGAVRPVSGIGFPDQATG